MWLAHGLGRLDVMILRTDERLSRVYQGEQVTWLWVLHEAFECAIAVLYRMVAAEATTSTAHAIYAMDMRPAAQVILLRRSRDSFSDAMACLTQAESFGNANAVPPCRLMRACE